MNILITGSYGQLGSELQRILASGQSEIGPIPSCYTGATITAVDMDTLDIADMPAVQAFAKNKIFDVILNCAAMTNVDGCEANPEIAFKANALGARNMAMLAADMDAKIVHVSTDYVFDGVGAAHPGGPEASAYCEWDNPAPNTVYGKSKLLGETYVREACPRYFILRTAWLYGYVGNNFVKTILKVGREKGACKVVNDQVGNPTNAADLAHHMLLLAATESYGLYHCTCNGICSWFEFTKEIMRLAGVACEVTPCTTEEFPRPAPRPAFSALDNLALRSTVGDGMRDWKSAIAAYMAHYDKSSGEITL